MGKAVRDKGLIGRVRLPGEGPNKVSRCPAIANKWDTFAGRLSGVLGKSFLLIFSAQPVKCLNTERCQVSRVFGTIFAFITD